ncbi:MAG TPA: hypothetical protein VJU83_03120 [Burkholderiales bacterium]|nr:hypothetical protein [Burkholderiales bacterium]
MNMEVNPLAVFSNELHWIAESESDGSDNAAQNFTDHALAIIEGRFDRIAQTLAGYWGSPAFDAYMERLLIDERGNRQGFPPDVAEALLRLSRLHGEKFGFGAEGDVWLSAAKQKHN